MNTLEQLSELYDSALLELLRNGREIMDNDGNLVRVPVSAADLNVIRSRLRDCGITAAPTSNNPIGNIVEEMRRRGAKLPEISDEPDAATG